ncbi:hypothetical protein E2320_022377, partial [Naja naja]
MSKRNKEEVFPTEKEAEEPKSKRARKDVALQQKRPMIQSYTKIPLISSPHPVAKIYFEDHFLERRWHPSLVQEEGPEKRTPMFCLQELKCAEKQLPADIQYMAEYPYKFWACSNDKEGYSGVALLSKDKPLEVTWD